MPISARDLIPRVTGGSGSFDQKILTKISPLIGGMDILDFGRETKKYRIDVLDFLDCGVQLLQNSTGPWVIQYYFF